MLTTARSGEASSPKPARMVMNMAGTEAEATAAILAARLSELGLDAGQDGTAVCFTPKTASAEVPEPMTCTINKHDAPGFAAEKILDTLEEKGLVRLDAPEVSDDDEARIEDRLKRLGYLE
jgi:hypothetical protein